MQAVHLLSYLGVAAVVVFLLLVILLHLLPTSCNALCHPVSGYSAGKFRGWVSAAFVALGIGAFAVSIALARELGAHGGGKRVIVGVVFGVIFAVGIVLLAFLRPVGEGEHASTGKTHTIVLVIAYVLFLLSTVAIGPVFRNVQEWKGVAPNLEHLELAVVVFVVLMVIARIKALRFIFGLFDRLFLLSGVAWFVIIGLQLAHIRG